MIPTHVRRRRVDLLEHGAECLAVRAGLHPQRSWRANLNWNMPVLSNRFRLTSGATYSLNLNQQSQIDLNFNRIARFTLPGEEPSGLRQSDEHLPDDRRHPVARRAGDAELRAGHRLPVRSSVAQHAVQLRCLADRVQLGVPVERRRTSGRRSSTRRAASAAASTAERSVPDTQWARGDRDARHQITYNVGYTFHQAVSVTAFGRFQSGNPFTPIGRPATSTATATTTIARSSTIRPRRPSRLCATRHAESARRTLRARCAIASRSNSAPSLARTAAQGPWSTSSASASRSCRRR